MRKQMKTTHRETTCDMRFAVAHIKSIPPYERLLN